MLIIKKLYIKFYNRFLHILYIICILLVRTILFVRHLDEFYKIVVDMGVGQRVLLHNIYANYIF